MSEIRTSSSPLGSLAAERYAAEQLLIDAEHRIEALLDSLYGSGLWSSYECGESTIDVYGCTESPAAVDTLRRAGFSIVWEHPHPAGIFSRCACRAR